MVPRIIRFTLLLFTAGSIAIAGLYFYFCVDFPKISSLADYRPPIITTLFSDNGSKIAEFYKERRIVIPYDDMPEMLVKAFIAAEDARFFEHIGIDVLSIIRAFLKNIEAGNIVQGGSTITQQVAKSFFLTPVRSYRRKIKEAILAYRIDKKFSKKEILYLYLNQIYMGHGAYGVQAAAENYFGKSVKDLSLAECSMLAGLPQAPSRYSPFSHPEKAKERQIYVLNRMVEEGYINRSQAAKTIQEKLDIRPRQQFFRRVAPYYSEHVRRYVEEKYGANALYKDGLKIYTAVDVELQQAALAQIQKGLRELDKRQGFRGPVKHLEPVEIEGFSKQLQEKFYHNPIRKGVVVGGVVIAVDDKGKTVTVRMGSSVGIIVFDDMRWARKPDPEITYYETKLSRPGDILKPGDVVLVRVKDRSEDEDIWQLALEQEPAAQAALLCIEAETGHVRAMVGGRDFRNSQFNRAVQARRQPGSAFKPVIYAAALDKGYTPATMIVDSPVIFQNEKTGFEWKPKNYGEKFYGPTLLRTALAKSRNVVTIKIVQDIGIDYVLDYARKLGITSDLSRNLSLSLGSSGVSLLELTTAYSVFTNRGYLVPPKFVTKIVDREGNVIEQSTLEKEKRIEETTAYIMTSLLEKVVKDGTGWRIRALGRPAAGKTGTTDGLHDAWFVGYTHKFITGVWVGFDNEASLGKGETGSRAASPIWLSFMQKTLKNEPIRVFQIPKGIVFSKIDSETGLLPLPTSKKTIFECFKEGSVPTEYSSQPNNIVEGSQFFKSTI